MFELLSFFLRRQLEFLIKDHVVPHNMTVFQAVKVFGLVNLYTCTYIVDVHVHYTVYIYTSCIHVHVPIMHTCTGIYIVHLLLLEQY